MEVGSFSALEGWIQVPFRKVLAFSRAESFQHRRAVLVCGNLADMQVQRIRNRENMKYLHAVLIVVSLFIASIGSASGPPPKALWEKVRYSELIVIAEVSEVVSLERSAEAENGVVMKARLEIEKVLHGHHVDASVDVFFWRPDRTSTAPLAFYKQGDRILVFLEYFPDKDEYRTFDSRYGIMVYSDDDASPSSWDITLENSEKWENRIAEIQEILEIEEEVEWKARMVDWLVGRAVSPDFTFWDDIAELHGRFGYCWVNARDCDSIDFPSLITDEHREMMLATMRGSENAQWRFFAFARILKDKRADQVVDLMLDRLDPELDFTTVKRLAEFIADVKDDSYLVELTREITETNPSPWQAKDLDHRRRIIDHFIASVQPEE